MVVRLVEWIVSFGRVLALLVRHLVCRRRLIREPPWERRQVLEACVEVAAVEVTTTLTVSFQLSGVKTTNAGAAADREGGAERER